MANERGKLPREDYDVDLSFLPVKLQKKLMPFQKEGVKFAIRKNGRCLIADEMGLGKTLQALCVSYYYRTEWPLLIVVPSSLRYPWIEELERWLPEIDPHSINLIQGGGDISDISRAAVTIVTYGLLRHPASRLVQEALFNQHFKVVIVDESHYIKNRKAAGTKFLVPLLQRATHKLLLTGTPALARPEELFPQLDSLCPGDFGTWTEFTARYCDAKWQYFGRHRRKWSTAGASNLEELQMMMAGKVMIRRLKKNVLSQLPPKQRQRIAFELKDSQLKKELDSTWEDLQVAIGRKKLSVAELLSAREALQQEQTSATEIYRLLGEIRMRTCTAKIGPVKDYIKMLCENAGLKLIVFAHHHVMMDSLTDLLHDLGVKFIRIDGHTPQQDRPRLVHQFQNDTSTRVAVLSMRAAGVGLTLTAAKLVVFAELDWTPGTLEQCEDRAHRIGQHDTVHVHYLVAKGTLDEWVWAALAHKTTVVTTTLNGETQVLRMDDADAAQVECLTNADPFTPRDNSVADVDITSFFQTSQTPQGQKTVLDYFSSARKRKMDDINVTRDHGNDSTKKSKKTHSEKSRKDRSSPEIFLIDSDSDEQSDFKPAKLNLRMPKSDLPEEDVGNFDLWSSEDENGNGGDVSDKEKLRTDSVKREDTWSCRLCTFLNHSELRICEMCNSPKVKKNTSVAKSSGKCQRCKVSLGITQAQVDSKVKAAEKIEVLGGDSVRCHYGNGGVTEKLCAVGSPGVTPAASCRSVGGLGPEGHSNVDMSDCGESAGEHGESAGERGESAGEHGESTGECEESAGERGESAGERGESAGERGESAGERGESAGERGESAGERGESAGERGESAGSETGQFSELDLLQMSDLSESDIDASEDKFDACCRLLTDDSQKSKDGDKYGISHDAAGATPVRSSLGKGQRKLRNNRKCYTHRDHEMSDSSNDSADESLAYDSNEASGKSANENNIWGHGESRLDARTEHNMSHSPGVCQQDLDTRTVAVDPALVSDANSVVCKDVHGDHPRTEGSITVDRWDENSDVRDEGSLTQGGADEKLQEAADTRVVNIDGLRTHAVFLYSCSRNTSRIFLYDDEKEALNVNFVPLDVEMANYGELPGLLLHPANLRLVRRFVKQWNSLAVNKRRLIVKSGEVFLNPCLLYEELKSGRTASKQRYMTKADVAAVTLSKADEVGGSVRVISRSMTVTSGGRMKHQSPGSAKSDRDRTGRTWPEDRDILVALTKGARKKDVPSGSENVIDKMKGILQAVDAEGRPLCVNCQQPYQTELVGFHVMKENPWQTRFCCRDCMQQYWMRTSRGYSVQQVFESEHGVCQLCQVDAHELFLRVRNCPSLEKRATLIQESCYKVLKKDVKDKMVKHPQKGLFWNVDHITPVVEGGGECDVDNLRTLCTVCHRDVTAQQNKDRAKQKQRQLAAKCGDITAFFSVQ